MRKPKNRESASTLLAMGHKAYESNKWGIRSDDNVTVIMSPQVGAKQVRILSRKEALKLAAKQRLASWGYHENDTQFKRAYAHLGVFLSRGRIKAQ